MMNQKTLSITFQSILTISLFSYWAAFALLVINKLFYNQLPGYTIGRICIWELVALMMAWFIARLMIIKWGIPIIKLVDNERKLTLNPYYGVYFGVYFLIAVIIGIWQFWMFSQQF